MRGKPVLPIVGQLGSRNIPAYAGKTFAAALEEPFEKEHPRVCGENFPNQRGDSANGGTSPRMRGKLQYAPGKRLAKRNIPAYAGKTSPLAKNPILTAEHPRVCGENTFVPNKVDGAKGTSPRMRGKPHSALRRPHMARNIPAYAGKTQQHARHNRLMPEHPRVCGENRTPHTPIS